MEKKKRRRRKEEEVVEIEQDVITAVGLLVDEIGFANITLSAISEKSKTYMEVLYANYGTVELLLNKFTLKYRF